MNVEEKSTSVLRFLILDVKLMHAKVSVLTSLEPNSE